jgi:hypothetical protein
MVGSGKNGQRRSGGRVSGLAAMPSFHCSFQEKIWLVSVHFCGDSESLTSRKSRKKESARLNRQNRRMFPAMRTSLQTSCERVQLTLTVCLLVACAANVALVYAWL